MIAIITEVIANRRKCHYLCLNSVIMLAVSVSFLHTVIMKVHEKSRFIFSYQIKTAAKNPVETQANCSSTRHAKNVLCYCLIAFVTLTNHANVHLLRFIALLLNAARRYVFMRYNNNIGLKRFYTGVIMFLIFANQQKASKH